MFTIEVVSDQQNPYNSCSLEEKDSRNYISGKRISVAETMGKTKLKRNKYAWLTVTRICSGFFRLQKS